MQIKSQQNNYKRAFTLAEVLITLGIIGIVAAMVLPTLMNNVQDKVLETQRKKAGSVLANGYKKMMADNEVFYLKDMPLFACDSDECQIKEHRKVFKVIKDGFGDMTDISNSLPVEYKDTDGNSINVPWAGYTYVFITPDGFVYGFDMDNVDINSGNFSFNVYADVNGKKNPNTANKDLIVYNVSAQGTIKDVTCTEFNCGLPETNSTCSSEDPSTCMTKEACEAVGNFEWHMDLCSWSPQ